MSFQNGRITVSGLSHSGAYTLKGTGHMAKRARVPRRTILTVRWDRTRHAWHCREAGWEAEIKVYLIRKAAAFMRDLWKDRTPGQLRVYGKNGRIQFERTYGRDPKRYPS